MTYFVFFLEFDEYKFNIALSEIERTGVCHFDQFNESLRNESMNFCHHQQQQTKKLY